MKPTNNKTKAFKMNRQTIVKLNTAAMGHINGAAAVPTTTNLSLILLNCNTSLNQTTETGTEIDCQTTVTIA